jgi:AcrR family transcriptional regulator
MNNTTKAQLSHAARVIIQRDGADKLTLEAVAKEAGISKGGLLYHFPTKSALISHLIEEMVTHFNDAIQRHVEHAPASPGRWCRAFIRASAESSTEGTILTNCILAATANDPSLLEVLRQQYAEWQRQLTHDGLDPVTATVIRLAMDGLYVADIYGFAVPTGTLREQIVSRLLALTMVSVAASEGTS